MTCWSGECFLITPSVTKTQQHENKKDLHEGEILITSASIHFVAEQQAKSDGFRIRDVSMVFSVLKTDLVSMALKIYLEILFHKIHISAIFLQK